MSLRTILAPRAALRPSIALAPRRTLTQTRSLGLKESNSQTPDPETSEKHKQDSLSKQKQGKGHWKPELASDSEEHVKADRAGSHDGSEEAMRKLQERTKRAAEETHKAGTSMQDHN